MEKKKEIHTILGTNPILISAPHTRPIHIKEKGVPYIKAAEGRMVEIVSTVSEKTGAWGVFTKGEGEIHHWEQELRDCYKKHIHSLIRNNDIRLFIEVHGSRASRPFMLDYDFIIPHQHPHDHFVEKLIVQHAKRYFPEDHISTRFFRGINGIGEKTFTYSVRETFKIPAVQFEVNKRARTNEEHFNAILSIIHKTITKYHQDKIQTDSGVDE